MEMQFPRNECLFTEIDGVVTTDAKTARRDLSRGPGGHIEVCIAYEVLVRSILTLKLYILIFSGRPSTPGVKYVMKRVY
jgi:hypothetical protein